VSNRLDRDQYRQDIRDANYAARRAGLSAFAWIVIVVISAALISAAVWGVKVATSGAKGAGDVQRQTNSGTNRIGAQEHFEALYGQIKAYDQQLDQAAADKRDNPGDRFLATNYSGLVKQCIDARNQYDADANKVTQAKWRDSALPYQIDTTAPETDCKEQTK
jgi:hypothetical protein